MTNRVVVLGLDGLDFQIINHFQKMGYLSNLDELKESGAWGKLKSTIPPNSPTAWNSMITGLNPAKHGVFDFYQVSREERGARLITRRRGGKAIWQILSEKGKRAIVINIPCTYPPDEFNGLMISGFMAPLSVEKAIYPPKFYRKLKNLVPEYQVEAESKGDEQAYLESIEENTKQKIRLLEYCLQKEKWDFLFLVLEGPDRLQHKLWDRIMDGEDELTRYYQLIDSAVGMAREHLTKDDTLMVVSDHGFRPIEDLTFINELLVKHGFLKFRKTAFVSNLILKKYLIPLLKKLGIYGPHSTLNLGMKEAIRRKIRGPMLLRIMDWDHSQLVALTDAGVVYTPRPMGEKNLDRIKKQIKDIVQIDEVYTNREAFGNGPFLNDAPGLVLTDSRNDLRYEITSIETPSNDRCAVHDQSGIFYATGKGLKKSYHLKGAGICDIAPTVLYTMGLPVSSKFDGVVLRDILTDSKSNS